MATSNSTPSKVITGKVRFSYAQVFKPASMEEGGTEKYSISLIIPKSDTTTIEKIEKACEAVKAANMDKLGKNGKLAPNLKMPLRDGDIERSDNPEYADSYFLNASSLRKPQIVDVNLDAIMDQDDFYSGCYGRASINFYAFNTNGNKGIAVGLNNLQKLEDGEPLAGGSSAEADFADDLM